MCVQRAVRRAACRRQVYSAEVEEETEQKGDELEVRACQSPLVFCRLHGEDQCRVYRIKT